MEQSPSFLFSSGRPNGRSNKFQLISFDAHPAPLKFIPPRSISAPVWTASSDRASVTFSVVSFSLSRGTYSHAAFAWLTRGTKAPPLPPSTVASNLSGSRHTDGTRARIESIRSLLRDNYWVPAMGPCVGAVPIKGPFFVRPALDESTGADHA